MRHAMRVTPLPLTLPPSPPPPLLARPPAPAQPTKSISSERSPIAFDWWWKAGRVASGVSTALGRPVAGGLGHCMLHAAPFVQPQPLEPPLLRRGAVAGQATTPERFDAALCVERRLVAQRLVGALVLAVPVVVRGREIATCAQSVPARLVRAIRWGGGRGGRAHR